MRYKTLFVVCLLLMSVFAAFCVPNASAADKNYLKISANTWPLNNRVVNNGAAFVLGDKSVTFRISMINIQFLPGHPNDYWIQNVTAKVVNQRDANGNQFNILDFSNGENTVKYANPPTIPQPPITQWAVTPTDVFQADVVTTAAAGTYNLTIDFTYDYCVYDTVALKQVWTIGATDTDYVYVLIDDGLNVDKTVHVFDESNNILDNQHYLYAGTTFQKVGISVTTVTGLIGEITATITLDAQTATYISLYQPSASTTQLGGQIYFKYRATVNDGTPPARYSASVEIKYDRWYGQTNQKVITAQKIPLEFIVDFTPMLSILSPASFTVNQGTLATNLTEVTLKNSGNTELTKLNVWINIGNYLQENGYYFNDNPTYTKLPISLPALEQKEKLGKGETWQVDFTGINVFKYLPEGEHRIPLGYSGYYFDDGTAGGSSDFKTTNDATYLAIKQVPLYLTVIVPANPHDFQVQSTSSINLGQKMKDISISLNIKNLEEVGVLYSSIMVGTKDQTTSKVLLINPKNTGSAYLEPATLTEFPADSTESFTFNADVAANATDGYYNLPVTISGTDANTMKPVSTTVPMSIRVNPVPPQLIVTGVTFDPKTVVGGKDFTLTINVKNVGNDVARQIYVTLVEGNNGGASISTDYIPDVAKADSVMNPFSVPVSRILLTTPINPGDSQAVQYTVHADKNLVKGKDYQMYVYVDYTDDQARSLSYNSEVTLQVTGSMTTKPADYSGILNPLIVWIIVIIIVFILAIVFAKMVMRPRRPSRFDEALPSEPMPREHTPPSGAGTATAAPVATQTVQTAAGAQTFKVCPACHKSVPANQVTCPHCGCAL